MSNKKFVSLEESSEFRRVRNFIAVAEHLNFRRAAEALGTSQPSLSQQIRGFEEALGIQLLKRDKRSVRLTSGGVELLAAARRALAVFDEGAQRARETQSGSRGTIIIGTTGMAMVEHLPTVVRAYRAAYPNVTVRLRIMRNPDLLEALRAGIIELGFAANFEPNDGIRAERLWEFSPRIVLQSDHKLARSTAVKLRDLNGETLIVHPRRGGNAANGYVMALCRDQEFVPGAISEVPEVADLETLVGLVSCGLGVTILPSAFESMQWPDVVFRPILGATYRATVWAGWRAEHATSLVENFVALARSSCKARE